MRWGVEGRLEFFRKFIQSGAATLPYASLVQKDLDLSLSLDHFWSVLQIVCCIGFQIHLFHISSALSWFTVLRLVERGVFLIHNCLILLSKPLMASSRSKEGKKGKSKYVIRPEQ